MSPRAQRLAYKAGLLALAALLWTGAGVFQGGLNRSRQALGFTRDTPLEDAPATVRLTTEVLGSFRGLIANALWVRALQLQDEDKFFEMVQLSDWITKLQPHMKMVWIVQAWNMAYNISIKFSNFNDRWFWVKRGFELLRDQALRYNPHEVLLYRELAWIFQHKIGDVLDDAHGYFKNAWAAEMKQALGSGRPDFEALIHPKTDAERARTNVLRGVYKLDPAKMKEVDERYGPLEWRLPETHAIYWASVGRQQARSKEDLMQLRRAIFQSMQMAFRRGRLIEVPGDEDAIVTAPNLEIIPQTDAAYEEMQAEEVQMKENIQLAHRNFLLDAVYFLYTHNRLREANQWLAKVKQKFKSTLAADTTLEEYALKRVGEDVTETNPVRTRMVLDGLFYNFFYSLAIGEESEAETYLRMAQNVHTRYQGKIAGGPSEKRVSLEPLGQVQKQILDRLLDAETGLRPALAAQLRTRLNLPAPASTNAPPAQ